MENYKTPLKAYQADLKKAGFFHDPAQDMAVQHTQRLFDDLLQLSCKNSTQPGFFSRFFNGKVEHSVAIKGLYFWGGVGRGKTYLIDTFYNCLPFEDKMRIHFHSFMQTVHRELRGLKNTRDPLLKVADQFAQQARVICFDEFHVADITDAMILGNLLDALFERNVTLVATSNEHPDELYAGGLQRQQFLPAIELIKSHTEVLNIDSGVDYRFRVLEKAEIYHSPLDEQAEKSLADSFFKLSGQEGLKGQSIDIEARKIQTTRLADGIIWFDFNEICDGPRGAADYIEIAQIYQTVLISNVPVMTTERDDHAKRFMTLIDEFYDRNVKLIISAEAEAQQLYKGKRLAKGFRRTISRLQEMGTKEYLATQHISE